MRISEYRAMWLFVFFDLPVTTPKDRKNYCKFRQFLLDDGFTMMQFSVYMRHSSSKENRDVHAKRVKDALPPKGTVNLLTITDKQFALMDIFASKVSEKKIPRIEQLELFEESDFF